MAVNIGRPESGGLGWSLGPYFIISSIGSGKFGTVYYATEKPSGREVALKLVPLDGAESEEKVEAERLGAQLQQQFGRIHKGLVPEIFDHQPRASFYAIAMELVRGEQLREVIARGPLPGRRAVEIALAIARFLEHAHKFETDIEGVHYGLIVHADLKPDHVLLLPNDEIRVLDFGIAKALAERTAVTTNKWGSMPYASPERLQSDGHVNEHADFWSLGVMLFEMIAGRRPYQRIEHNPSRLNNAIIAHEAIEPLPADTDPILAAIVRKLLAPQIERRYASASAIVSDLEAFLAGRETMAGLEQVRASEQTVRINGARASAAAAAAGATVGGAAVAGAAGVAAAGIDGATHVPWPRDTPPPLPPVLRAEPVATDPLPPPSVVPPTEPVPRSGSRTPVAVGAPSHVPQKAPLSRRIGKFAAAMILMGVVVSEGVALTRAERVRAHVAALEVDDIPAARQDYRRIADLSPLSIAESRVRGALVSRMLELANRTIFEYRTESPTVAQVQWEQARDALELAAEISDSNRIRSKLLYVNGQLKRILGRDFDAAIRDFEEAARLDRESPDPYLGLARVYAYGLWDADSLSTAIGEAEERGYKPGRRERAQLGDVHRVRAERARQAASRLSGDARIEQLERARDGFAKCVEYFDGLRFYGSDDNLRTCRRRLTLIETALTMPLTPLPEPPAITQEPSTLMPEQPPQIPAPRNQTPTPRPFPTPPVRVPVPTPIPAVPPANATETEPAPLPPSENPLLPKPPGNRPPDGPHIVSLDARR